MRVIKAPEEIYGSGSEELIFLAGSIEMGTANDWQEEFASILEGERVVILNPRRDDWDSSWEQSIDNPKFREQVEWELTAMQRANVIVMHFEPNTKSPITLLELGLFANSGKLIVHCPEGYWRKGNVDIVCNRFRISQVENLSDIKGMLWSQR